MAVKLPLFLVATVMATMSSASGAQSTQQNITFFSQEGMSGARYSVSGDAKYVRMPYVPRSVAVNEGGTWQVCSEEEYRGNCLVVQSTRSFSFGPVRSVRKLGGSATGPEASQWKTVARLDVRDRADRDAATSSDRITRFQQIQVCSERNLVRIRRAEVQLGNGYWQRLFVPLALEQGACSNAIDLIGGKRRIRAVRFEYEAWTAGMARGTIVVKALPYVTPKPR